MEKDYEAARKELLGLLPNHLIEECKDLAQLSERYYRATRMPETKIEVIYNK